MFLIFLLFVRAAEPGPPPASPSIAHTVAQAVALGMLDYNEMMKQLSDAAGKIGQARTASVAAPLRDALRPTQQAAVAAVALEQHWNAAARVPGITPELQNMVVPLLACPFGMKGAAQGLADKLGAPPAADGADVILFLSQLQPALTTLDSALAQCRTGLDTFVVGIRGLGVEVSR